MPVHAEARPETGKSQSPEQSRVVEDAEGGLVRRLSTLSPFWLYLTSTLAIGFSTFHIYTAFFGTLEGIIQRVTHLGIALVLTFLLRPFLSKHAKSRPSLMDIAWAAVCIGATVYLIRENAELPFRMGLIYTADLIFGGLMIIAVFEAARRLVGVALPIVAGVTIAYAWLGPYLPSVIAHRGFSFKQIIHTLYLTTEGLFGIPIQVSSSFIVLFIILGALLKVSGAGQFFTDLAYGFFGRTRGGPAKVAIAGSSLFGMVSGSAIANVTATGIFTIPLMKRSGFDARFSGAVESVSSTGGQLVPPIMGAAAFLIAEILGISYLDVAVAAAIPALLYYATLFVAVDLRAAKIGLRGTPRDQLPDPVAVLLNGGYLFLVPVTLVYLLAGPQFSPLKAAVYTIGVNLLLFFGREVSLLPRKLALTIGVAVAAGHLVFLLGADLFGGRVVAFFYIGLVVALWFLTRRRRDAASQFVHGYIGRCGIGLREGAMAALEVAAACAMSGIIIGMFMLTGLGLRLSGVLVDLSGGSLPVLLILTALASLILGMGLPTVAAYIVLSVLVAPSLINMGVVPIAAHLFIFYFGIISAITPPVALAAYAASAISGANPMQTGLTALKLGLAGFIIPFMIIYSPQLLMQGQWYEIVLATLTAFVGAAALAAGLEGYLIARMNLIERALLCVAGFLLIFHGLMTDLSGGALILLTIATQAMRARRSVVSLQ